MTQLIDTSAPIENDGMKHSYDLPAIVLCIFEIIEDQATMQTRLIDLRWSASRRIALSEDLRDLNKLYRAISTKGHDQACLLRALSIMPNGEIRLLKENTVNADALPLVLSSEEKRVIEDWIATGGEDLCRFKAEQFEKHRCANK